MRPSKSLESKGETEMASIKERPTQPVEERGERKMVDVHCDICGRVIGQLEAGWATYTNKPSDICCCFVGFFCKECSQKIDY